MKKIFLVFALTMSVFFNAKADNWGEKLLLYLPNRVLDCIDVFTVNVGAGPILEGQMMATRAANVGFGIGKSYMMYWDYNRQFGFGVDEGYYWSLITIGEEDKTRTAATSLIKEFREVVSGVQAPTERNYRFPDGPRDYWQIGGALGGLILGQVYIHPVEIADVVLGFFFIDIKNDDIRFDDYRK